MEIISAKEFSSAIRLERFRMEAFAPTLMKIMKIDEINRLYANVHTNVYENNPGYRYLIGPVSISNHFSNISKALIIRFIVKNHYNKDLAEFIEPRTKFRFSDLLADADTLLENGSPTLHDLDDLISEIEPMHRKMPVLLKKYIQQNGKIIGFNIAPRFNNCLDGFLLLDLYDLPPQTLSMLEKEC